MPSVYIVSTTWIIKFDTVKLMHTRKHYALVFTINLQLALAQEPVLYIITLYRLILSEVTCIWRTWASLRPHCLQTSRLWGEPYRRPSRLIDPFSTPEARVSGFWAIQTWYKPNNHAARRAHHHYESGTQQIHCQFTIRWACTLTMILVVHERSASLEMVVMHGHVQPPFFVLVSRGPTDFAPFRRSVEPRETISVLETALSLINAESVLKLIEHDTYCCLIQACIRKKLTTLIQ